MILYDENYSFLGMSDKILNRLGFDDLDEFCTYYRDFAELFEKNNGLIYNFENFSWIDFVLYGGANKDSAIVKTRNGEKLDVKISIDEIKIKDDTIGMSKIFAVKLMEKGIIKEKDKQANTSHTINLSSMLDDDTKTQESTHESSFSSEDDIQPTPIKEDQTKEELPNDTQKDLDINLSFIKNEALKEDSTTTIPSVSLDFLKDGEETKKAPSPIQDKQIEKEVEEEKQNNDVVLNFFNSTLSQATEESSTEEENNKTIEPVKPQEEDKVQPLNFQFLKKDDEDKDTKIPDIQIKNDFILEKEKKDIEEPKIELNLKKEEETSFFTPPTIHEEKTKSTPTINLNHLKDKKTQEKDNNIDINIPSSNKEEPIINLNFLNDEQKKQDIPKEKVEIKDEEIIKTDKPVINLNFLKTKEDEKPTIKEKNIEKKDDLPPINLNFLKLHDPSDDNNTQEINPEKKSKIIKQIKEDISEIDKPQNSNIIKDDENEIVINEALKSILKIDKTEENNTQQTIQQVETKEDKPKEIEPKIIIQQIENEDKKEEVKNDNFNFLPNINISEDEKKEILKDFVDDANYNVSLIKKYFDINDFDSIKFLSIKIKSSAQIIELNDITNLLEKIISEESDKDTIKTAIDDLSTKVENLKQYL